MFCAISGEPPSTPVVSKKSGLVYEQRLILKYIGENGKDPITGDELQEDDLVLLKQNPRTAVPRPPTLTSVPALLTSLQNEYDAVMLELFTLKKAYDSVRQELAHALYANDSAHRVVARLMHERDEARTALASIQDSLGHSNGASSSSAVQRQADAEMVDASATSTPAGLPKAALDRVEELTKGLSANRKAKLKRKPAGYAQVKEVPAFAQLASLPSMHGTKPPGVTALDVSLDGTFVLTGGKDKQAQVYNRTTDQIVAALKGHTKAITHVVFGQSIVGAEHGAIAAGEASIPAWAVSAAEDGSVRIWQRSESSYALSHTLKDLKASVSGLAVHPSGDIVLAASVGGAWAVYDAASGERLLFVETDHQFTSLDVHPDGILVAIGTSSGSIIIYDIRNGTESAKFVSEQAASPSIDSVHFSENGYLLASGTTSAAEIWDLRKLSKAGTIEVQGADASPSSSKTTVRFDPSAQFLAVVNADVRIYANKSWDLLWKAAEADSHSSAVTDARWAWANGALYTCGLDRTVRVYGTRPADG